VRGDKEDLIMWKRGTGLETSGATGICALVSEGDAHQTACGAA
jgi:hypothetical protein